MPGGKKNTVYRRKRKGKPFTGVQRYARKAKKMPRADREVTNSASSSSCDEALSDAESASISASRLKMRPEDSPDSSSKISDVNDFQGEGYRLVDLKKLYATLSEAHVCEEGSLTLNSEPGGF
ncbi:uncharacterized protein [Pocillopora verrucosa]|uniref:uncharacterized protein n=1 Tax=Pocillopora verrucosa TaxID=203993 RepID=UPI0033414653